MLALLPTIGLLKHIDVLLWNIVHIDRTAIR